jgi:hypothetical protein
VKFRRAVRAGLIPEASKAGTVYVMSAEDVEAVRQRFAELGVTERYGPLRRATRAS